MYVVSNQVRKALFEVLLNPSMIDFRDKYPCTVIAKGNSVLRGGEGRGGGRGVGYVGLVREGGRGIKKGVYAHPFPF